MKLTNVVGELTEENMKKIFDEMGKHTNPDTFMVSSKALKELIAADMVRYDRVKCSWELLSEKLNPPRKGNSK